MEREREAAAAQLEGLRRVAAAAGAGAAERRAEREWSVQEWGELVGGVEAEARRLREVNRALAQKVT
jgi:hypothetical protein